MLPSCYRLVSLSSQSCFLFGQQIISCWAVVALFQISLCVYVYMDPTSSKQWSSVTITTLHHSTVVLSASLYHVCHAFLWQMQARTQSVVVTQSTCIAATNLPNKASCLLRELLQNTLVISRHPKHIISLVTLEKRNLFYSRIVGCWQVKCTLKAGVCILS